jgi:hypothetical protein
LTWYHTTRGYGVALPAIRRGDQAGGCTCCPASAICAFERGGNTYHGYICPRLLQQARCEREQLPSGLRPRLVAELDRHLRDDLGAGAGSSDGYAR